MLKIELGGLEEQSARSRQENHETVAKQRELLAQVRSTLRSSWSLIKHSGCQIESLQNRVRSVESIATQASERASSEQRYMKHALSYSALIASQASHFCREEKQ